MPTATTKAHRKTSSHRERLGREGLIVLFSCSLMATHLLTWARSDEWVASVALASTASNRCANSSSKLAGWWWLGNSLEMRSLRQALRQPPRRAMRSAHANQASKPHFGHEPAVAGTRKCAYKLLPSNLPPRSGGGWKSKRKKLKTRDLQPTDKPRQISDPARSSSDSFSPPNRPHEFPPVCSLSWTVGKRSRKVFARNKGASKSRFGVPRRIMRLPKWTVRRAGSTGNAS